jgi:hypothetical protein
MTNYGRKMIYLPDRFGRSDKGVWTEQDNRFDRPDGYEQPEALDLSNLFSLHADVGVNGLNGRDDVGKIELLLGRAGLLKLSQTDGLTGLYGLRMEDALKRFQKQNGLKTDGFLRPHGPTITALEHHYGNEPALHGVARALEGMGRNGDTVLAHLTRDEAKLLHTVTDGGSINPETGLLEFWDDGFGGYSGNDDKDDNDTSGADPSRDYGFEGVRGSSSERAAAVASSPSDDGGRDKYSFEQARAEASQRTRSLPANEAGGSGSGTYLDPTTPEARVARLGRLNALRKDPELTTRNRPNLLDTEPTNDGSATARKTELEKHTEQRAKHLAKQKAAETKRAKEIAEQAEKDKTKTKPKRDSYDHMPVASAAETKAWNDRLNEHREEQKTGSLAAVSPPRKPAVPARPIRSFDMPEVSPRKKELFKSPEQLEARATFFNALSQIPDITQPTLNALMSIYDEEGGLRSHPGSLTVSGITNGTLKGLINSGYLPDVPVGTKPASLTTQQRADFYQAVFDNTFYALEGLKTLERIDDQLAKTTVADTLFSQSPRTTAKAVQSVTNDALGFEKHDDRVLGTKTLEDFNHLVGNPVTRDKTLNALADKRWDAIVANPDIPKEEYAGWKSRIDSLRP